MLFFAFILLGVVGAYVLKKDEDWGKTYFMECLVKCGGFCIFISTAALLISAIVLMSAYINVDGYVAESHQRYDALVYQLENDVYENDNDLGKRELYKDIQGWNEDLANYRAMQENIWVGIYIPNIYDQFEFIELK
jgi:hypothetical protein